MNQELLTNLASSLSPDNALRTAAEAHLTSFDTVTGGAPQRLSDLVGVALNPNIPAELRLAAALASKRLCSSVDSAKLFPPDTADRLVEASVAADTDGSTQNRTISLHLALGAAELVKRSSDPAVAPRVCTKVANCLALSTSRCEWRTVASSATVLNCLLAICVARRAPQFFNVFKECASTAFNSAFEALQRSFTQLCSQTQHIDNIVPRCVMVCTKIMRCLMTKMSDVSIEPGTPGASFVTFILGALSSLRRARASFPATQTPSPAQELISDVRKSISKTALKLQRHCGAAFGIHYEAQFLSSFDEDFAHSLATTNSAQPSENDDAYALFVLRFVKDALERTDNDTSATTSDNRASGSPLARIFFPESRITALVNTLIQRDIVETSSQLRTEVSDPERALAEEDVTAWKYLRRACAEALLISLAERFGEVATQPLLAIFSQALSVPPTSLSVALAKEAVYRGVGLCIFELMGQIPWARVLAAMAAEVESITGFTYSSEEEKRATSVVLRRRLAWTLGTVFMLGEEDMPIQATFAFLTRQLNDDVLLLAFTAAAALQQTVDCSNFDATTFAPFARDALNALFSLVVGRAKEVASKIRMLGVIIVLVSQAHDILVRDLPTLCGALCTLWSQTAPSNVSIDSDTGLTMLRTRILDALTALVETSVTENSHVLVDSSVSVLEAARRAQDSEVLLEAALDLWEALFKKSARITENLLGTAISCNLAGIIASSKTSEILHAAATLVESIFVCGGVNSPQILASLLPAIAGAVPELNRLGVECVLKPVCTMFEVIQQQQQQGVPLPRECEPFVCTILAFCARSAAASFALQSIQSGKNPAGAKYDGALLAHLTVVARAAVCDSGSRLASALAPTTAETVDNVLSALYAAFTASFEQRTSRKRAKLLLVGSLAAFPAARPLLPQLLVSSYATAARTFATQISGNSLDSRRVQVADDGAEEETGLKSERTVRLEALENSDPINLINIPTVVASILGGVP